LLSAENEVRRYHNVAQLKTASQSSSLSPNNAADLAVDDSPATCARTDEESEASWMVDLGQTYVVSHLRINTGWLIHIIIIIIVIIIMGVPLTGA